MRRWFFQKKYMELLRIDETLSSYAIDFDQSIHRRNIANL